MSRLQKALFLSDKGYADLKKAIFACTLTNLAMLLPFCVTVMIFSEILTPCRIEHIISDESFLRLKEAVAQEQD